MLPDFFPDFTAPDDCWQHLTAALLAGVQSGRHPYHLITIASLMPDGTPDARLVVLRHFDPDERRIRFHTDHRSPKVTQLQREPRITILAYDPTVRLQLRIPAVARLHHQDEVAREAWIHSQPYSRACYAVSHGAGVELPLDSTEGPPLTVPADDEGAFANFCVVSCTFEQIDVLALHAGAHRRGRLTWPAGRPHLTRLAP